MSSGRSHEQLIACFSALLRLDPDNSDARKSLVDAHISRALYWSRYKGDYILENLDVENVEDSVQYYSNALLEFQAALALDSERIINDPEIVAKYTWTIFRLGMVNEAHCLATSWKDEHLKSPSISKVYNFICGFRSLYLANGVNSF